MAYLGLDVDNAGALAVALRSGARHADNAQRWITKAAFLADLPGPCVLELDSLATDLDLMAGQVDQAAAQVAGFQLEIAGLTDWSNLPPPTRTPVPEISAPTPTSPFHGPRHDRSPQWNANPGLRWNQVQQVASHNSYAVDGGVATLFEHGVRAFEIDIHRTPPVGLAVPALPWRFGSDHDDTARIDWHVYHAVGWSHREYRSLSQGLSAIADLPTLDPLTVFVDNKDAFAGAHTASRLDQVLRDELGGRLFTPGDLLARSPGATTVLEAVQRDGWPSVHELEGRVLVVLTDEIESYRGSDQLAFVAAQPNFSAPAEAQVRHEPEPDVVFYNVAARRIAANEIEAMQKTNTVLRTYFNPLCPERLLGDESIEANYRAVDVPVDGSTCESRVVVPPVRVPGPGSESAVD